MRKTFHESMQDKYYARTIIYIAIVVTLIFLTQLFEVLLDAG